MLEKIYSLKIFEWIDKNIIDDIIESCQERQYTSWEVILKQKAPSNWEWYIIKSWNVEIIMWNEKIAELWEWDIFWEMALLNEENRTASVIAKNEIIVYVLNLEHLIEIINNGSDYVNKTVIKRIEENLER